MKIGRCFNDALEVYKKNVVALVVAAFLFEVLLALSLSICAGPLVGGVCVMAVNAMRREDKTVDFGDFFAGFRRFLSLVGLFYLTLIPILIGLALLIVPGLLLMTIWFFPYFLVIDRGESVFNSLRVSSRLVQRSGFGAYFLLVLLTMAIAIAPSFIPVVGVIVAWFVTPLVWLMEASAYIQEVDEKKPLADMKFD